MTTSLTISSAVLTTAFTTLVISFLITLTTYLTPSTIIVTPSFIIFHPSSIVYLTSWYISTKGLVISCHTWESQLSYLKCRSGVLKDEEYNCI